MLSLDSATTSASRFAFVPLGELLASDKGPWMECLKAFLAATQLIDKDPDGALAILRALSEAPLLRYLAWTTAADPSPLIRFHNDQAFFQESREALEYQRADFFAALAGELASGPIGAMQVQHYWREHSVLILQTFLRMCTLAARGCQKLEDHDGRERWCHQGLMTCVIFELDVPVDLLALAEPDEWWRRETPVALTFVNRWNEVQGMAKA